MFCVVHQNVCLEEVYAFDSRAIFGKTCAAAEEYLAPL